MYAQTLTINRGVDNQLQFQFLNQEQKPVNIAGKEITCRILDSTGREVLIKKALTPLLPLTGIAALYLSQAELEDIQTQYCFYSLEIPDGTFDFPVFVDADGGARGKITIVNSVLPAFVPALDITIPTHLPPTPNANVANITYWSSTINTADNPELTLQAKLDEFTGNIAIFGSTLQDFSIFYPIEGPQPYTSNQTLNNVSMTTTTGVFSCANTEIRQGQSVTITGTPTGNGTIDPYTSGTVYYITSTNGINNFTLSTTQGGFGVDTTVGPATGLNFAVNGYTGSVIWNVEGFHPYVRLLISNRGTNPERVGNVTILSGDVTNVLARLVRPWTRGT